MRILLAVLAAVLALVALGCEKPKPPKVVPESAKVASATSAGLDLVITLDAENPNSVPLIARKVKAHVKLNNDIDLGEVTVDTKIDIPANEHAKIVAPISMKWGDVGAVTSLAMKQETIPFTVDGVAVVGFESLNFEVPFKTQGVLTRDQIKDLGLKNMPTFPSLPTSLPSGFPTSLPF